MDVLGLLREVSGLGIDSVIVGAVILLAVRYWMSEMRRDISKEIDDKVGSAKTDLEQLVKENRQEIAASRTETRQELHAFRASVEESLKENRQEIVASRNESRQELDAFRTETRQEIASFRTSVEESFKENRQEIDSVRTESRQEFNAARTYSEQSHQETRQEMKEIMLHLIDVRERLANIEGRLGAPTPRMPAVSPPLERPAEEPSAQS